MTDKAELSLLLDYYGAFLTDRQRELTRMSADDDMSLSEIAEQVGISRQAVRDSLSKASDQLRRMESEIGAIARDMRLRSVTEELRRAESIDSAARLKEIISDAVDDIGSLIR